MTSVQDVVTSFTSVWRYPYTKRRSLAMDNLTQLYVEITTRCNLSCEMCVQRVWEDPATTMSLSTFANLMEDIAAYTPVPTIHFGGYGEPLVHPDILEMIRLAKQVGASVAMTTNGMLLSQDIADALFELQLDTLNVSVDGVSPDSYSSIRVRGDLDRVIQNLRYLHQLKVRHAGRHAKPKFALAFVAMKSNIHELPELARLASYVGAWDVKVSNVVPHTPEMEEEILYKEALRAAAYRESPWAVNMSLPRMDMNRATMGPLETVYDSRLSLSVMGTSLSNRSNYCRFAQEGFAAVRADGEVTPCLSLLHTHPEYIHGRRKVVQHHSFGNIEETDFNDIWTSRAFTEFRQQVRDFNFSPCTTCGGCERFPQNVEDCMENSFPTCGGCLWAQGIIECP
jgi:MoaA/NifB/PqqE/SkfB family radical SAM enzyme